MNQTRNIKAGDTLRVSDSRPTRGVVRYVIYAVPPFRPRHNVSRTFLVRAGVKAPHLAVKGYDRRGLCAYVGGDVLGLLSPAPKHPDVARRSSMFRRSLTLAA